MIVEPFGFHQVHRRREIGGEGDADAGGESSPPQGTSTIGAASVRSQSVAISRPIVP